MAEQIPSESFIRKIWSKKIADFELEQRRRSEKMRIRHLDYSVTLPPKQRARVAKIIDYKFLTFDEDAFTQDLTIKPSKKSDFANESDSKVAKKMKPKETVDLDASTCSQILHLEEEFQDFDKGLDEAEKRISLKRRDKNWQFAYLRAPRKDRVRWPTKLYAAHSGKGPKTLDEQATELMDASADSFTQWVNSLGSNKESHISKHQVKSLFSIEGEKQLLGSIQTEPKEVRAIAQTVADEWNLPEMAIELKYERHLNERCTREAKPTNKVAFGRTVPQRERPWQPPTGDFSIKTVFPEKLLSMQDFFKGIDHLRTTKALVDFFKHHPQLETPRYFLKHGMLRREEEVCKSTDIPLYEQLKLKY